MHQATLRDGLTLLYADDSGRNRRCGRGSPVARMATADSHPSPRRHAVARRPVQAHPRGVGQRHRHDRSAGIADAFDFWLWTWHLVQLSRPHPTREWAASEPDASPFARSQSAQKFLGTGRRRHRSNGRISAFDVDCPRSLAARDAGLPWRVRSPCGSYLTVAAAGRLSGFARPSIVLVAHPDQNELLPAKAVGVSKSG